MTSVFGYLMVYNGISGNPPRLTHRIALRSDL